MLGSVWWCSLCVLCALVLAGNAQHGSDAVDAPVNVVLLGATGNLAQKYLWQALFDLFVQEHEGMRVVGAGTSDASKGENKLRALLPTAITCSATHGERTLCEQARSRFIQSCRYMQLKLPSDFVALDQYLEGLGRERGRIFYLSIPPSAYASTTATIHHSARPESGWLRIAIEKPFGHDFASAARLADQLRSALAEEEIFRVDHYLGKVGVQQIRQYGLAHAARLAEDGLRAVHVAVLETEDCADRTAFYEETGVIRDMLQNHVTEVLLELVDSLATASSVGEADMLERKSKFVSSLTLSGRVLLGQYEGYRTHVATNGGSNSTSTPTFAAVRLNSTLSRFQDVPIVLRAGKKLAQRTAFAEAELTSGTRLRFHIQGLGRDPHVEVAGGDAALAAAPQAWRVEQTDSGTVRLFPPPNSHSPYFAVLQAVLFGDRSLFVDTDSLLASWRLWTHVLERASAAPLRFYTPDTPMEPYLVSHGRISFSPDGDYEDHRAPLFVGAPPHNGEL